jgi:hypothetical protein
MFPGLSCPGREENRDEKRGYTADEMYADVTRKKGEYKHSGTLYMR